MWPNPQETADLVTFTVETLNGEFHFLCSVKQSFQRVSYKNPPEVYLEPSHASKMKHLGK